MEEQAREPGGTHSGDAGRSMNTESAGEMSHVVDEASVSGSVAFEIGLKLLVDGLQKRAEERVAGRKIKITN